MTTIMGAGWKQEDKGVVYHAFTQRTTYSASRRREYRA